MQPLHEPTDNQDMPTRTLRPANPTVNGTAPAALVPMQEAGDRPVGPKCLVVMYHYVHDQFFGADAIPHLGKGVRGLSVSEFETQLDLLTSQLEPVDWVTLSGGIRGKTSLPARSFFLTFDDGLREHAEIVLPILERRGLKGTFFVPGCVLSKPKMLSAHLVHLLLEALGENRLVDEVKNTLAGTAANLELSDTEEAQALKVYHYESAQLARLKFLLTMKLPLTTRASLIHRLFERHVGPQQEWTTRWYLNTEHIRELHARGHTIGGHSFGHEPYGRLDAATLERDIGRSAWALQNILGAGERPFAYPFGSVHTKSAEFLGAAGFVRAFGTASTWVVPKSPSMNLPRIDTIRVEAELQEAMT